MLFCKYKDLFGKVGEGLHSYRIYNIAIIDVIFTFIGAVIIHKINSKYKFVYILFFLFFLGIIMHRLFCVRTTIDRMLFN